MFQGTVGTIIQSIGIGMSILVLIDVVRRQAKVFDIVGQGSKTTWILTSALCIYATAKLQGLPGFIGVLACLLYFFDLRPKLDEASRL